MTKQEYIHALGILFSLTTKTSKSLGLLPLSSLVEIYESYIKNAKQSAFTIEALRKQEEKGTSIHIREPKTVSKNRRVF